MAAGGTLPQIAVPQKRVRMPVADHQPLVQRKGCLGRHRCAGQGGVLAVLDHAGRKGKEPRRAKHQKAKHPDTHLAFPTHLVPLRSSGACGSSSYLLTSVEDDEEARLKR